MHSGRRAVLLLSLLVIHPAQAADEVLSPVYDGQYAVVLGGFVKADKDDELGDGGSVSLGAGLRRGLVGVEGRVGYRAQGSGRQLGASLSGLIFPFEQLKGLYALLGIGLNNVQDYPGVEKASFNLTTMSAGLGYVMPIQLGSYRCGFRMEALYQHGQRNDRYQDQRPPSIDLPIASKFDDLSLQLGLNFPFGRGASPAAVPEAAEVVPVENASPQPIDPSAPAQEATP